MLVVIPGGARRMSPASAAPLRRPRTSRPLTTQAAGRRRSRDSHRLGPDPGEFAVATKVDVKIDSTSQSRHGPVSLAGHHRSIAQLSPRAERAAEGVTALHACGRRPSGVPGSGPRRLDSGRSCARGRSVAERRSARSKRRGSVTTPGGRTRAVGHPDSERGSPRWSRDAPSGHVRCQSVHSPDASGSITFDG